MHILVVDDNVDIADAVAQILRAAFPPATVDVGHDGAQGLRLAVATHPCVVVMDLDMPVLDGVEAALAMRKALRDKPPMLIAITGCGSDARMQQARQAFDHLLVKPIDFDHLIGLIEGA